MERMRNNGSQDEMKRNDFVCNVWKVVRREVRLMRQRPVYLLASVGVLAFCTVFFLTFLKDRQPYDLPIGIADMDNTSLSRNFVRQIEATKTGETVSFASYAEGREALQTGRITALFVLPDGLYDDLLSNRQPTVSFYVNTVYFIGGSLAYKELLTLANLSAGAVQSQFLAAKGMTAEQIAGIVQPIRIDAHQIGNPTMDYKSFLVNALLPGILEAIVILVTVYALGSELKYGTSRHLLEKAGGSMSAAMLGKLIPYTLLFTALGIIMDLILYDWAGFPMAGSIWNLFAGTFALVLASEAVAFFIIGTLPVLRLAISIAALYSTLGFSMAGFSLPVEAMPAYIQGLAACFPVRHYYQMYVQEAIFAGGFGAWYPQIVFMLLFLFLPAFVYRRLQKAYQRQNFPRN